MRTRACPTFRSGRRGAVGTIPPRHADEIEQDEARRLAGRAQALERLVAVGRAERWKAALLENFDEALANVGVVFDDQHTVTHQPDALRRLARSSRAPRTAAA